VTTVEGNDAVANVCWVNKTVILNIGFALYYMQSNRKIQLPWCAHLNIDNEIECVDHIP
jgi:hypothetical protein